MFSKKEKNTGVKKEDMKGCAQSDPWIHRSKGMSCQTCMWYVDKKKVVGDTKLGRCRRHAPTMNGYPVVFPNDWCGDHKLDENKL